MAEDGHPIGAAQEAILVVGEQHEDVGLLIGLTAREGQDGG